MAKNISFNNKISLKNYSNLFILKCVFLGDSGVGKSCLIERYMNNNFDSDTNSTIGVAFNTKYVSTDDFKTLKLDIWDTAGQERYNAIMPLYYRSAGVIIIVFEIGNSISFSRAKKWIDEIKNCEFYDKNQVILLLGNKCDGINEKYDLDKYMDYAKYNNILFFSCSAKTGFNVDDSIMNIINEYIKKTDLFKLVKEENVDIDDYNINYKSRTKYCCYQF